VDIYEDENTITLKMGVPGIDEKEIDVRMENNTLTVHGERKIEKEEKEEKKTSVALSGNMEASPVPSRCPVPWI
jgi:HSP20 family molecular chaperone IbpA